MVEQTFRVKSNKRLNSVALLAVDDTYRVEELITMRIYRIWYNSFGDRLFEAYYMSMESVEKHKQDHIKNGCNIEPKDSYTPRMAHWVVEELEVLQ